MSSASSEGRASSGREEMLEGRAYALAAAWHAPYSTGLRNQEKEGSTNCALSRASHPPRRGGQRRPVGRVAVGKAPALPPGGETGGCLLLRGQWPEDLLSHPEPGAQRATGR